MFGCEKFWIFLFGRHFLLRTDNRAIQLIFSNPNSKPPARILRWALRIMDFDCKVEHVAGKANVADFLSRQPFSTNDCESIQERNLTEAFVNMVVMNATPEAISVEEVAQESGKDEEFLKLASCISGNNRKETPAEFKNVFDELLTARKME